MGDGPPAIAGGRGFESRNKNEITHCV